MTLTTWAAKWGVPVEAFEDLKQLTGMAEPTIEPAEPSLLEAAVQQQVLLAASKLGMRLWRNNNGAAYDEESSRVVRYGLANTSAALNKVLKSHDLIGITPYVVTAEDVGRTIGVFTSLEVKRSDWVYRGTEREVAQRAWMELVLSLGGISKFIKDAGEL